MATVHEMTCQACGTANRAGARFCRKCGRKLRRLTGGGEGLLLIFFVVTSLATTAFAIAGLEAYWNRWKYNEGRDWFLAAQIAATVSFGLAAGILLRRAASRAARIVVVVCLFLAWAGAGWLAWANTNTWADQGYYMKHDLDEEEKPAEEPSTDYE